MRLIVALFAVAILVQSQPPSPAPPKATEKQQEKRNGEATTGERPQSSQPATPAFIQNKSDDHKTQSEQKSTPDWWIISLTAGLVLLAAAQFWAMHRQAYYMRRGLLLSVRQTRNASMSARASQKSAELPEMTLKLTQRADVLVSNVGFNTQYISASSSVLITLENFGPTRADELWIKGFMTTPEHPEPTPVVLGPLTLGAHDTMIYAFAPFSEWCSRDTFERIRTGQITLTFELEISYLDIFKQTRTDRHKGSFNARLRVFSRAPQNG